MKTIIGIMISLLLVLNVTPTFAQDKIVVDGSTTVGPIAKAFAEYYMGMNKDVNITVSESGSGNGAKSLINSVCHVGAMSRFMKDKEFGAAVEKGVKPVFHVVALDGIAMVVHPSNPITQITKEQIKDIYLGKIKSWKALGGPDKPIVFITRDTNSGTFETFEGLVMNKEKIAGNAEVLGSNGAIRSRVQSTPTAIGYVGLGFIDNTVKALKVNGVMPTLRTIAKGTYPIARPLFMATNGYPKMGSHLYQFITLYLTRKGQEIVKRIGFVPVTEY
ncbi:MAG: PstS family phosphate ABC transporter substrate-binding protein [Acidobacteriota bacterium]|nr:PstS family phosphate ABC transporter substrate-binding protein [Acidobacteriota bacterium]